MTKHNNDNLRIKRKYLIWLEEAKGYSAASIDKAAASISQYDDWLDGKDYRAFHSKKARAFKRHLANLKNERTGAPLSASTIGGILRDLKAFFYWLADQAGYKSKISYSHADYLSPDKKSDQARRSSLWKPHPSPEQTRSVLNLMPRSTEIERRNRAFIAFLFLTGSRETAAISMPLGQVDLANKCAQFDGKIVNTKFGKSFTTAFFPAGDEVEKILKEWITELKQQHLFSATDPLIPKTKVGVGQSHHFEALGISKEFWKSASGVAKIFKSAFTSQGFPPFSPHRIRDTIAELAKDYCKTPEDYKAWSQNIGHEDVLTTFRSYGSVSPGRQVELMERFRWQESQAKYDDLIDGDDNNSLQP